MLSNSLPLNLVPVVTIDDDDEPEMMEHDFEASSIDAGMGQPDRFNLFVFATVFCVLSIFCRTSLPLASAGYFLAAVHFSLSSAVD